MSRFLEALQSGRVLLMDGAMGTELQRAGIQDGECYELWNLTHPEKVRAIHQAYVDAGAEVLLTNTFQANPAALARHGLQGRLQEINHAAVGLAQVGRFIGADIGPMGTASAAGVAESFPDVDALLLETCSDLGDLAALLKPPPKRIPILFSWTFRRNGDGMLETAGDLRPEDCANSMREYPVAALGVNCGRDIGMDEIVEIVRRYRSVTDLPLFARPNAGTPTRAGDRWVYPHTPEQMAARLPELLEAGVSMVGGCCGTTPAHIAAFRKVIDAWNLVGPASRAGPKAPNA